MFSLHQIPIDLVAQARFCWRMDVTIHILNILYQAKFVGTRAGKEFKEFTILHRHSDVQIGHVIERIAAVMNFSLHVEAFGQMA